MTLLEELGKYVKETHANMWATTDGRTVPELKELGLGNEAVKFEGTVLYADLAESTTLVKGHYDWFSAEVYKNYHYCAGKIIRARGGEITAYDGDRIMAVLIGDSKNTSAAKCALQINWAVDNILQPATKAQYPNTSYVLKQKVGIDSSSLFVARTRIRGSNHLVWVGNSANNAAKMAALSAGYASYISAEVYSNLNESSKYGGDPKRDMWTELSNTGLGYKIYGSNWIWSL